MVLLVSIKTSRMNQKFNPIAGVVGSGMAAGPAFYETTIWLSTVAILGIVVLVLAGVNSVMTLRRNLKLNDSKDN